MDKKSPILVIGAGSVGERHLRNLLSLGFTEIHILRSRNLPLRTLDIAQFIILHSPEEIRTNRYAFAIICSPTSLHLDQTLYCLERGIHVLVEKPLGHQPPDLEKFREIIRRENVCLQVAYMLHFHPLLQKAEAHIRSGQLGKLLHIHTHWGSYLPDWHPWEDHKHGYAARKSLGGGVALTLSHDLDIANHFAASPMLSMDRRLHHAPQLDIETESIADFHIAYQNGITAHVHLNYIEKPERRYYGFICENGTIGLDYTQSVMHIHSAGKVEVHEAPGFERNQMFLAELESFIACIDAGGDHVPFSFAQLQASYDIINMCI